MANMNATMPVVLTIMPVDCDWHATDDLRTAEFAEATRDWKLI